jgi:hypothetical protein
MFISPPPKKKRTGYVYLIKSGIYHKIGLTRRKPETRLKEITTPEGVSMVHVIETSDPEGLEQFLHNEFKDKRAEREWFRLDEEDVEWIKAIKEW